MVKSVKKLKRNNVALIISLSVIIVVSAVLAVFLGISIKNQKQTQIQLENVYEQNFYDLVDNINNTEVKLSKALASGYNEYGKKMLLEVSKNSSNAVSNLNILPISINGIHETIDFANKLSAYTQILAQSNKTELSSQDEQTLNELHMTLVELKANLNKINKQMLTEGYNILNSSLSFDGDNNSFTITLQDIKSENLEYPTMIYDGPFSDSQMNKKIKALSYSLVSEHDARNSIKKCYKDISDNEIEYIGETNGKFETFDYKVKLNNADHLYAQVTKNGGKILTISGNNNSDSKKLGITDAIDSGKTFLSNTGINNVECVWNDVLDNDAYLNFAPVVNGIICYPDLVKVKVNLEDGMVIGYESSSYYMNHVSRNLKVSNTDYDKAQVSIPKGFKIEGKKLALIPLDDNSEKICYEFKCSKDDSTYYIYINCENGNFENVLKVIETDNGNLLM